MTGYRESLTQLGLLLGLCYLGSCSELYTPDIDADPAVLVVEGLVTDRDEPYCIKLSYAQPFDEPGSYAPVREARVYVTGGDSQVYWFAEREGGEYYSDPADFQATTGMEYTLNIETGDQLIYRSDPVEMVTTGTSETAWGRFTKHQVLEEDAENNTVVAEKDWIEFFLTTTVAGREIPGIRFEPWQVVFSYFARGEHGPTDVQPYYAWRTFYLDFSLAVPDESHQARDNEGNLVFSEQELVSFEYRTMIQARDSVPVEYEDHSGYYLVPVDTMYSFIVGHGIILNQYYMNESSTRYYRSVAGQLETGNRIFDPLPSQVQGNIRCVSDESRPALGLFEVSALHRTEYSVKPVLNTMQVRVEPVEVKIPEPPVGSVIQTPPSFWIF